MRLWKNWAGLSGATLSAWIGRVTKNACIDMVRRRRAYQSRVVASGDGGEIIFAASTEPGPDELTQFSELRVHIQHALAAIREPYRSIVIFREVQDMKYEEICDVMDLPLNTIKSYLHRGRRMLREKLDERMSHEAI